MSTKRSTKKRIYKKPLNHYLSHGTKNSQQTTEALEQLTGGPLTLPKVLLSLRLSDKISQSEFARMLGISRQQLCDIEKGRRQVNLDKAAEFAEALGYPKAHFVKLALQSLVEDAGLNLRVDVA